MQINQLIKCETFPCGDVKHTGYSVPALDMDPASISIIMISEAAPEKPANGYYAGGEALFESTTLLAFQDAGAEVNTFRDILNLGVYFTTAVKCAKTGYGIQSTTIKTCARLLQQEIDQFPNVKIFMLMGDVAIKAINDIAKRESGKRAIPAGSTYKIRSQEFFFRGRRAFPSYLQAGPSFFIEKVKRKMIAEDISAALHLVQEMPL
ncbi:MAG: uracil-DNA glycosylase [Anaerolineales bacterium]|nr:uracil-DNA glycosylase [Anaerolineales bacterium]